MKLDGKQRDKVLEWIAEGKNSREINKLAAEFVPSFSVSKQQVDYYRDSREKPFVEAKKKSETSALNRGFAKKENRVRVLDRLAKILSDELLKEDKIWLDDRKAIGSGDYQEFIDFKKFNQPQISELRAVFADIAAETGDRKQKHEHDLTKPLEIVVKYVESDLNN